MSTINSFCDSLNLVCTSSLWQSFEVNKVYMTCHQLKAGKRDSDGFLSSDVIINALKAFHELLSILINRSVAHGHIPPNYHAGTIIPQSGNLHKSVLSSYRPTTL